MKKLLIFLLLISCGAYAQGPHGNITVVSTGLKVDSTFLMTSNKRVFTTEFAQGIKLYMELAGIHGFSIRDGKSFPGCSMRVLDSGKKVILDYADLFSGADYKDGVTSEDAKVMLVNLTIGSPMITNGIYSWEVRIWDKIGGGEVTAGVSIKVVLGNDALGIRKTSGGLTCESTYVISDGLLETNKVKEGQKLTLVLSGMKGYAVSSEKTVAIGAKVVVKNRAGKNVMEYGDLFKDEGSFESAKAETVTMFLTIGDPIMAGESYTWTVRIWDKSNEKWIEASVPLEVVE